MSERYAGVKFNTVFLRRQVVDSVSITELGYWCHQFHRTGLTPLYKGKSQGNLSFRCNGSFIVTASGLGPKDNLSPECFVRVVGCDIGRMKVYAIGLREPSSESMLHYRIYELKKEIKAVFHGHAPSLLEYGERLGLPVTGEWYPYGSLELVRSVESLLDHNFVILRGHGFLALGNSMNEAGNLALKYKALADSYT
jgi:ribulose-5-phosphate 4-epimerase/fuculose-1-phosphate aldolase